MALHSTSGRFNKVIIPGVHEPTEKVQEPILLDGEKYSIFGRKNSIGPITLYNTGGKEQTEDGRLWVTNYRTILHFNVSYFSHAFVLIEYYLYIYLLCL